MAEQNCDYCVCHMCKKLNDCNLIDKRCAKCKQRDYKQKLYDDKLCDEYRRKKG